MLRHKGFILAVGLGFVLASSFWAVKAQGTIDDYTSNAGTPVDLDSSSPNFRLDSIMDFVGGESSPSGTSTGMNVMHGYHFLDDNAELTITKITAIPEKRYPLLGNNATYFLLEILPANTTYDSSLILWSNAAAIANGENHQTDEHGVWSGSYTVKGLEAGNYDIYLTGYSHLRRKLKDYALQASNNELVFTYDEVTAENMIQAGTLVDSDPLYPLLAGDAGVAYDADDSCGPNISSCIVGGSFSGDEWGDNEINSLDLSSVLTKLYLNTPTDIMKEDLDKNAEVNSIDLSMTLNNLYRTGDN